MLFSINMFVARRKLVWILSVLSVFVIVMTVNHYFYLDDTSGSSNNNSNNNNLGGNRGGGGGSPDDLQREIQLEMMRKASRFTKKKQKKIDDAAAIGSGVDDESNIGSEEEEEVDGQLQGQEVEPVQVHNRIEFIPKSKVKDSSTVSPYDDSCTDPLTNDGTRYIPRRRVVHLDFKGAPPKLTYLKALFPLLKNAGATTLLIEYEDMFPFWGSIRNISAGNAFSKENISSILGYARKSGLEVIPLVQTFGHLEMALKLEEFKDIREVPYHPQAICPSQEGSWKLVTEIIDQVMSLHPDSHWLHIGCDEVFHLGQCPLCMEKISQANNDPDSKIYHDGKTLFLQHVHRLGKYVRDNKGVIPIIWDDMLRNIPSNTLSESGLGKVVEPMVWVYIEDIDRFIDPVAWASFGEVFSHMWTASAYKGAFGERLYLANIQRHVGNNMAWTEVMRRETLGSNQINFRGLVLTGWSRYDHFAVLCELLPPAVPSLILNLVMLTQGGGLTPEIARRTNKLLQCSSTKTLMTQEELMHSPVQWDLQRCRYPGSNVFALLSTYDMNRKEIENLYDKLLKKDGWMTEYNVRHRFTSTQRVLEMTKSAHYLKSSLRTLEEQIRDTLGQHYDTYTTEEWIEQHIFPLLEMVEEINEKSRILTSDTVWPRRPLPPMPLDEDRKKKKSAYQS